MNKIKTLAQNWNLEAANNLANELFLLLESKQINEATYGRAFDTIELEYPNVWKSLGNRPDNRSLGRFALDIYETAKQQEADAQWFFSTHGKKFLSSPMNIVDFGIDNRGKVIFGNNSEIKNPDYLNKGHDEFIEIKSNWVAPVKGTYKKHDLENYATYSNVQIITVNRDRRTKEVIYFARIPLKNICNIIENCDSYKRKEVGYKLAYQFYMPHKKNYDFGLTEGDRINFIANNRLHPKAKPMDEFFEVYFV
jgi:ribosomal protein L30E